MPHNFARISELGFSRAGSWLLVGERLALEIDSQMREIKSVLYVFVVDGALVYVGKTRGTLKERLQRYKTPAKNALHGGSTNIKNNKNIRSSLLAGKTVEIYVLPDKHEESYRGFQFSRAAALEDDLMHNSSQHGTVRRVAQLRSWGRNPFGPCQQ